MCGCIVDDLSTGQIMDHYRVVGATRLGVERKPNYSRCVSSHADHSGKTVLPNHRGCVKTLPFADVSW